MSGCGKLLSRMENSGVDELIEMGFADVSALLEASIYLLKSRGKVVYVGQSIQPIVRIFQHRLKTGERIGRRIHSRGIERFAFDQIFILPCKLSEINTLEKKYIQQYMPKYNIAHKATPLNIKALVASIIPTAGQTIVEKPWSGELVRRI